MRVPMNHINGVVKSQTNAIKSPKRKRHSSEGDNGEFVQFRRSPAQNNKPRIFPTIYDYLVSIDSLQLSEGALEEFDRRNGSLLERESKSPSIVPGSAFETLLLRRGQVSAPLKRFARGGGPDLRDLRGFPEIKSMAPTTGSREGSKKTDTGPPKSKGRISKPIKTTSSGTRQSSVPSSSKLSERARAYIMDFDVILGRSYIGPPDRDDRPINFDEVRFLMPRVLGGQALFGQPLHVLNGGCD